MGLINLESKQQFIQLYKLVKDLGPGLGEFDTLKALKSYIEAHSSEINNLEVMRELTATRTENFMRNHFLPKVGTCALTYLKNQVSGGIMTIQSAIDTSRELSPNLLSEEQKVRFLNEMMSRPQNYFDSDFLLKVFAGTLVLAFIYAVRTAYKQQTITEDSHAEEHLAITQPVASPLLMPGEATDLPSVSSQAVSTLTIKSPPHSFGKPPAMSSYAADLRFLALIVQHFNRLSNQTQTAFIGPIYPSVKALETSSAVEKLTQGGSAAKMASTEPVAMPLLTQGEETNLSGVSSQAVSTLTKKSPQHAFGKPPAMISYTADLRFLALIVHYFNGLSNKTQTAFIEPINPLVKALEISGPIEKLTQGGSAAKIASTDKIGNGTNVATTANFVSAAKVANTDKVGSSANVARSAKVANTLAMQNNIAKLLNEVIPAINSSMASQFSNVVTLSFFYFSGARKKELVSSLITDPTKLTEPDTLKNIIEKLDSHRGLHYGNSDTNSYKKLKELVSHSENDETLTPLIEAIKVHEEEKEAFNKTSAFFSR